MKFHILILLCSLSFGLFAQTQVEEISIQQFEHLKNSDEDINILDIRTPKEFNAGHIKNAININFYDKDFDQQIQKLDKNKTIVVYCHSGYRSHRSLKLFEDKGFETVYDMTDGYKGWQAFKMQKTSD